MPRQSIVATAVSGLLLCGAPSALAVEEVEVYSNNNSQRVYNIMVLDENMTPVKHRPSFYIAKKHKITTITNYHWNGGNGSSPGTIKLLDGNGKEVAAAKAIGRSGAGGRPNVYWEARMDKVIPPGRYTITDTDWLTWSCNERSGNQGITTVRGIPMDGTATGRWVLKETKIGYSSHPQGSGISVSDKKNSANSYSRTKPDGIAHEYEFLHTWTEPPATLEPGKSIELTLSVENTGFMGVLGCKGWTTLKQTGLSAEAVIAPGNSKASKPNASRKISYKVPSGKAGEETHLTIEVSQGRGKGTKDYVYTYR